MVRKLIVLCVACLALMSFDDTGSNKILWKSSNQLTQADFKGTPPADTKEKGWSDVGIEMPYSSVDTVLTFKVEIYLNADRSWLIDTSLQVLKHEQGHFDIGEICARHLRRIFLSYSHKKMQMNVLKSRLSAALKEWNMMEQTYDKETNHSINTAAQQQWYQRIQDSLTALDAYRAAEGQIVFRH